VQKTVRRCGQTLEDGSFEARESVCLSASLAAAGPPVAVVRDLGRAMTPAVRAFFDGLGGDIPVLACHQHFLADVGGDLLERPHAKAPGAIPSLQGPPPTPHARARSRPQAR
jgi:hypothetical protein